MEKITLTSTSHTLALNDGNTSLYNKNQELKLGKDVLGVFGGGKVTEYEVNQETGDIKWGSKTKTEYVKSNEAMYFVEKHSNCFYGWYDGQLYAFIYDRRNQASTEVARVAGDIAEYNLFIQVLSKKEPWKGRRVEAKLEVSFGQYKEIKESGYKLELRKYTRIGSISYDGISCDLLEDTLKAAQELQSELYEAQRWFSYAGCFQLQRDFEVVGLKIKVGN